MKTSRFPFLAVLAAAGMVLLPLAGRAQYVEQTLSIPKGWSAVYLALTPDEPADEFFKDWPVTSVSAYAKDAAGDTDGIRVSRTGESIARAAYFTWNPATADYDTLVHPQGDSVLLIFSKANFSYTYTGIPRAPRLYWVPSSESPLNYVGALFDSSDPVPMSTYLAGADIGKASVYYMTGNNPTNPTPFDTAISLKMRAALESGGARLVSAENVSEWSGPLFVSPVDGIQFGESESAGLVSIRNDGATTSTVTVVRSKHRVDTKSGDIPDAALYWRDSAVATTNSAWAPWPKSAVLSKTLAPGETWGLEVGLDRRELGTTAHVLGNYLQIVDSATHEIVRVPLTAADLQDKGGTWPTGLWLGNVVLDRVAQVLDDDHISAPLPAGGTLKLRVLLHIDAHGKVRLLQRVTIAGEQEADGTISVKLYAPSADIPKKASVVQRLSCAALPVDTPVIECSPAPASICEPLAFAYAIGPDSPSNPFFHPLHPQFDNLTADFKSPAPDGDTPENYIGSVKPERFTINGRLDIDLDDEASSAPWETIRILAGTAKWTYSNVRREGPVEAVGTVTLTRISPDDTLVFE